MSEETNEAAKKPQTLTQRLIQALKDLILKKSEVRGAKQALRNCSRRERRAARWDAAASKFEDEAAEAAKAAEAANAAGDKKAAEEAGKAEETARASAADARERTEGIRSRSEDACREKLVNLRREREELIEAVHKLLSSISGYSRKDRKEVVGLRKKAGV